MIAAKLGVPVVPVRLEGLDRILHQTWKFPVRGPARVSFGAPIFLEGNDYAELSRNSSRGPGSLRGRAVRGMAEFAERQANMAQSLIGKGSN